MYIMKKLLSYTITYKIIVSFVLLFNSPSVIKINYFEVGFIIRYIPFNAI